MFQNILLEGSALRYHSSLIHLPAFRATVKDQGLSYADGFPSSSLKANCGIESSLLIRSQQNQNSVASPP
jgi:hypothetical protein